MYASIPVPCMLRRTACSAAPCRTAPGLVPPRVARIKIKGMALVQAFGGIIVQYPGPQQVALLTVHSARRALRGVYLS